MNDPWQLLVKTDKVDSATLAHLILTKGIFTGYCLTNDISAFSDTINYNRGAQSLPLLPRLREVLGWNSDY